MDEINREKLIQFLANIDQEIANMLSGEGKHRPGVLHLEAGKNSCPVMNRLEILKNTPTKENLETFLELAVQDFGALTAEYFRGISRGIFKAPLSEAKPAAKAFDVAIKDSMYDMFRTARISLEPKQVEQIETHALKLAKVIEDKIGMKVNESVKTQLGALVEALHAKEDAERRASAEAEEAGNPSKD